MVFRDFTFPEVVEKLGLRVTDAVIPITATRLTASADFVASTAHGSKIATVVITEKA
jgi:hypothetical protein